MLTLHPPLLSVRDLHVQFTTRSGPVRAVNGVSFDLNRGETLGIVGESGCGKSVTALSMMRLLPEQAMIGGGQIALDGVDLLKLDAEAMRALRWSKIAMIFQDPMTSLNPVLSIGRQFTEVLELHLGLSRAAALDRAADLLDMVGIAAARMRLEDYPHQFSGGMRQRVMIAMALSCDPDILIADEPTTALDVTIQAQIVELIAELAQKSRTAVMFISHNLGVVAQLCDRVNVMYAGHVVETALVEDIFSAPRHPYTLALLRSVPRPDAKQSALATIAGSPPDLRQPPSGCAFAPRCEFKTARSEIEVPELREVGPGHCIACHVDLPSQAKLQALASAQGDARRSAVQEDAHLLRVQNLQVHIPVTRGLIIGREVGRIQAVDGVSLDIRRGETIGLVGESGCGKSTLGRAILQLQKPTAGSVAFDGHELTTLGKRPMRAMRQRMQMIFQDPYSSLSPRMTIGGIVGEPLDIHGLARGRAKRERVASLLDMCGLKPEFAERYPHEFSGGQRQRVGIARALAVEPEFIVADEPVSALDVSVQAQVINLMSSLQERLGLTYLFIGHDLSVVRHISDRVAVMYLGRMVEFASRDELYDHPAHPYTRALLSAAPAPDPAVRGRDRIVLGGDVPSPLDPPSGCRFHKRCPIAIDICSEVDPAWRDIGAGHLAACHRI